MAERKFSKGEARNKLLEQLTDEELTILFRWMQATYKPTLPDYSCIDEIKNCLLREVSARTLYRFAHFVMFGTYARLPITQYNYLEILGSIRVLKEKLRASHYSRNVADEIAAIQSPGKITAWNSHIGHVAVTKHALERFYQYTHNDFSFKLGEDIPGKLVRKFKKIFKNAVPRDILGTKRVRRIINNRFEKADYLLNTTVNLRFVVLKREASIVTVERPR